MREDMRGRAAARLGEENCATGIAGRRGLTLIELLVVVAIVAVLTAVVLPAVQQARETARRTQCHSHLRQIGVALALHVERDRAYPVGCIGCRFSLSASGTPVPQRFISWNMQLLPLIEEAALWDAFDFDLASYRPTNKVVGAIVVDLFLCPSTTEPLTHSNAGLWKDAAFTDYGGLYGVEGRGHDVASGEPSATQWLRAESLGVMLYEELVAPRHISDGLSKTAVVAEMSARRLATETEWINGHNIFAQEASTPINGPVVQINEIGSPHPGGATLLFCDGHIEFVAERTDQAVLNAMLTKAGGEP